MLKLEAVTSKGKSFDQAQQKRIAELEKMLGNSEGQPVHLKTAPRINKT